MDYFLFLWYMRLLVDESFTGIKMERNGQQNLAIVILAAGKGTRMKSSLPKVCHPVGGLPMLSHVFKTSRMLLPKQIVVVISPNAPEVEKLILDSYPEVMIAYQTEQKGTGHAVMAGVQALRNENSDVLVLYGDTPLLQASTLEDMLALNSDVTVMSMRPIDPAPYGRIFLDSNQRPNSIIEAVDCSEEQLKNNLSNSGVMRISGMHQKFLLAKLTTDNKQSEYLLTDLIQHAYEGGLKTAHYEAEASELLGVNDRVDLSRCEQEYQNRLRFQAMRNGVTLIDPQSVTFCHDTQISKDVTIQPNVFFGPNVQVAENVTILSNCYIEGAVINSGCTVGPFARIRPGTVMKSGAKVGNFVEIKNAHLGAGAKVNHLSYVGDSDVGEKTNIGAGTITCNYDGFAKHKTKIGSHVFIGSNTALIAPVEIGDNAVIGAGSVITKTVQADSIAVSRSHQHELPLAAKRYWQKKSTAK